MSQARITIGAEDKFSGVFAKLRGELSSSSGGAAALSRAFSSIGPALGASLGVGALVAFTRATINGLDALNDLKDATGASVENLSGLEDVAIRTGTSMDTVGSAVLKLNQALAAAKPGSDQAAAIEAIGLSVKDLKALDPAQAVVQVAIALGRFADDGNKARLTQELFGKSLREVAPLLNDLAEKGKIVATVTADQAKQAEDFNKQLFALQKNSTDAARAIAGPLISALNGLISAWQRARGGEGVLAAIGTALNTDLLRGQLAAVNEELERLAPAAQRATDILNKQPDSIRAKATLAEVAQLRARALELAAEIDRIQYGGGKRRPANEGGGRVERQSVGEIPPKPDKAASAREAEAKRFTSNSFNPDDVNAARAINDNDVARVRQLESALRGLFEMQRETRGDPGVVAAIAKTREELEKLTPGFKEAEEAKKRLDAMLAATPTGVLKQVLSDIELLNKAFDNGAERTEEWAEAVRAATSRIKNESGKDLSEFAEEAQRKIQGALGDTLESTLDGNFRNIGKLWLNLLKTMAIQAASAQLATYLFGSTTNGKNDGKGFVSMFFQSALASYGGAKAKGGTLGAGQWGIAGEAGPEIIRGPATITPMAQQQQSRAIVVNVYPPAGSNAEDFRRSSRQVAADMGVSIRRSGALA